ncbi:hypothetical protein JCM8208_004561 [Rhodotorula glutinis]
MAAPPKDQALSPLNLAVGAAVSLFEITTLGQPLEVLKTQAASHRGESLRTAISSVYARGGFKGFYQGLIPWAWIESSTTGGILLFTASAVEHAATDRGMSRGGAGLLGGVVGGAAQAYLAMGICTRMKTVEITRAKSVAPSLIPGQPPAHVPSAMETFRTLYQAEGLRGINKGVNAVALRQATNWGSRIGIARAAEQGIKQLGHKQPQDKLSGGEKVLASAIGGALGCWNHPIEVIRVEMQSLASSSSSTAAAARPTDPTILGTARYILATDGWKGLFRGVTPRIGLSVWRTICLVSLGDHVKSIVKKVDAASGPL